MSIHRKSSRAPCKSWCRAIPLVLASFIGIRRAQERETDLATVTPVQIIISGIIGALLLVLLLVFLVKWIVLRAQSG